VNLRLSLKLVIRSVRSRMADVSKFVIKCRSSLHAFVKTRTFALSIYICISMIFVSVAVFNTKIVQVNDGSGSKYIYTFRSDPVSILKQDGITLTSQDEVSMTKFQDNFAKINLFAAFPVKINADGKSQSLLIARGTISEVLQKAGITLGIDDLINQSLDLPVTQDMEIVVNRVAYKTLNQTSEIPFQTISTSSTLLKKGVQRVQVQGKNGQLGTTVKQQYIDGVMTNQQILSQTVISQPVNAQVSIGTAANTPYSLMSPPSSLLLNDKGVPAKFSKVIDAIATAYSYVDGSYTATGNKVRVGYVAVNPNKIPYGSKLYIMSADGSYVYGYAIAADTGGFVYNGSGVDVDLFLSTNHDVDKFGRQRMKIYILS